VASLAYVVAIPALNEEEQIGARLQALDGQVSARLDHIVQFANNCSDGTVEVAQSVRFASGARLHVVEASLAPGEANAGTARRRAMNAALPQAGPGSLLLTTDADGLVDPDWLAATL
jgi:cellulose synthase/poly-beta-1,6-N-acetylglucosamine synthase-like glycosyltransferase